jgi:hypothetical protein
MKAVLCFAIASSLSFSLFAQGGKNSTSSDTSPRLGFKGGLSMATIIKTNDNSYSTNPLWGFNGGAIIQLPLGKIVGIQTEVLFSQKGYRTTGSSLLYGDYDYRRYLNFLDIPILLRINSSKEFALVVGPQYSYLLSTHTVFKTGATMYQQTVNSDNSNITKNIFGGVIGADINLDEHFFIYARYSIDFKNNNGDGSSSTPAYKNQVIQLGLGVLL